MIDSNQKEIQEKLPELDQGVNQPLFLNQVVGLLQTVSVAPNLPPRNINDQIQILSNGSWKLYVWDNAGQVWKSVTLS